MKIEVYSKAGCGQCVIAKNLLKQRCLDFDELVLDNVTITVDDLKSRVAESKSSKPVAMLPQIFINDEHLGSFNDLRNFIVENEFACSI